MCVCVSLYTYVFVCGYTQPWHAGGNQRTAAGIGPLSNKCFKGIKLKGQSLVLRAVTCWAAQSLPPFPSFISPLEKRGAHREGLWGFPHLFLIWILAETAAHFPVSPPILLFSCLWSLCIMCSVLCLAIVPWAKEKSWYSSFQS